MANAPVAYEHYLAKGLKNRLKLLMRPEELPSSLDSPVIWQCLVTGTIEDRSYHSLPEFTGKNGKYGSHGQQYWAKHGHEYYAVAEDLGIEFVYDETIHDAPSSTRSPVRWRGRNGEIVVATLHSLKYGKMPMYLKIALGLEEAESESEPA